jgi:hypothetical protein
MFAAVSKGFAEEKMLVWGSLASRHLRNSFFLHKGAVSVTGGLSCCSVLRTAEKCSAV